MPEITKSGSGGWGSQGGKSSMGMVRPKAQFKMGDTASKSWRKRLADSRVGKGLSSAAARFGKKSDIGQSLIGGRRRRRRRSNKSGKKKRTKRRTKKARRTRRTRRR
jgi:hypothetical protein